MELFCWSRESETMRNVWHRMTASEKWRAYMYQGLYGLWVDITVRNS